MWTLHSLIFTVKQARFVINVSIIEHFEKRPGPSARGRFTSF
jgi:hypothetical protein